MSYGGPGGLLMGIDLGERYDQPDADDWTIIRTFVERSSPRTGLAAAREISEWLSRTDDDDELLEIYLDNDGNYRPDPARWTLRECLTQVAAYVADYSEEFVRSSVPQIHGLPVDLVTNVVRAVGQEGVDWLRGLPSRVESLAEGWALQLGDRYPSTFDYLLRAARADGSPAVLRLSMAGRALAREVATLRAYDGGGAVRVLESDLAQGGVLLEQAVPGRSLSGLVPTDDERATDVVAHVLESLWRPAPPHVGEVSLTNPPTFNPVEWLRFHLNRYDDQFADRGPLPRELIVEARTLLADLVASFAGEPVLLHGDLHHDNIVSSDRSPGGWLAIDPKGHVGDPGYDVAAMLYNPLEHVREVTDLTSFLRRRVDRLTERLDIDRDRILAWGFVKAMIAEVWFVESDGAPHGVPLRVAEELRAMR